jgi:integrase
MARPAQPPRLYLRKRAGRAATWVIKHLGQETALCLAENEHAEAAAELARFTAALKTQVETGEKRAASLHISTVLDYYAEKHVPQLARPRENMARLENLTAFFGVRTVVQLNGALCREFVEWRRADGCGDSAARRELVALRAALGFWHKEYTLDVLPALTLPKDAPPRADYLTRDQVARLLWAAWKGNKALGVQPNKHIARFILIGVYTGTRTSAILGLRWLPSVSNGWVDLDRGLLQRKGSGVAASKKRQPTVKLHKRLAVHLARWRRIDLAEGITSVVSFNGRPVSKLRAWCKVRKASGLTTEQGALFDPVKHHLRHTATTWLLQAGVAIWEVAGYVGMSPEILDKVYGHHTPDRQSHAASVGYGANRRSSAA